MIQWKLNIKRSGNSKEIWYNKILSITNCFLWSQLNNFLCFLLFIDNWYLTRYLMTNKISWSKGSRYTETVFTREQSAQFEWSFKWRYFGPCVRKITSRCIIWIAQFKWRSGGISSDASLKSCSEIAVPSALTSNFFFFFFLGGGGGGAMWPSNHFRLYHVLHNIQKHRKRELRACLIDRVPWHEPRIFCTGMINRKFGLSCTMHNSNIAITSCVYTV